MTSTRSLRTEPLGDALARLRPGHQPAEGLTGWSDERIVEAEATQPLEAAVERARADVIITTDGDATVATGNSPVSAARARARALEVLEHRLAIAHERDRRSREYGRPEGCWCLGAGGKHPRFLRVPGVEPEQWPFIFGEYCICPEAVARSATDAELAHKSAQGLAAMAINALWQRSNVPEYYASCSFETYPQDHPGQRKALKQVRTWCRSETSERWLYLHGGVGVGKTGLAAAVTRVMITRGIGVLFDTVPNLLGRLQAAIRERDGPDPEVLLQALIDAPFLVLDDLGVEKVTDWRRESLFRVVDSRKNRRLRTVITSNISLKGLSVRLDDRIASRIQELADVVLVNGRNLRVAAVDSEALPFNE